MAQGKHVAVWFEIPVTDIDRASRFYSTVLDTKLAPMEFGPHKMAVFPGGGSREENVVHGALVQGPGYTPAGDGPMIYLNGGEDLAGPLSRVEAAGGRVLQPKMEIGQHGFMALFLDTEGNRLALHSER
ncbi:MAG: VOC family protein [Nannocystaceae bacterium]